MSRKRPSGAQQAKRIRGIAGDYGVPVEAVKSNTMKSAPFDWGLFWKILDAHGEIDKEKK